MFLGCRARLNRASGRGHEGEALPPAGVADVLEKCRDHRARLLRAKLRYGENFPDGPAAQLLLTVEVVQDLERIAEQEE
jgi:hypothetical protein